MKLKTVAKGIIIAVAGLFFMSLALTLPLRWINPVTTAFILQDSERSGRGEWTPIERISPYMQIAVVAAEDQKFPMHHGFDFESISDALADNSGPRRGASTISQQLSKNLYLWPGKNLFRKGVEAYFTFLLETFLPKKRILEIYLNVIEFGPGIYGITEIAHTTFGKTPAQLTAWEASLIAAVLPNPKRMSPARPSDYVISRAAKIENAIRYLGGPSYLADM